jgi:hypothetical protein
LTPSDADRGDVVDRLRTELLAERLTLEQFEERAGAVYAATTLDELGELSRDLPEAVEERARAGRGARSITLLPMLLFVVVSLCAVSLIAAKRHGEPAPAPPSRTTTTLDPAQPMRDLAAREGWFNGCSASESALGSVGPTELQRPLDRLSDAVPLGPVEGYEVTYRSRVEVSSSSGRPWMSAGLDRAGAVEAYAASFNKGPPGPGGFGLLVLRFLDAASAQSAIHRMYTAYVCKFGGEPWTVTSVPGAVAAYNPGDTAQIYWAVGNIVSILDWSLYQDVPEAQRRAEAAAGAVMAKIDSSTQAATR